MLKTVIDEIQARAKLNMTFVSFIEMMREKSIDCVIDGANVGYCGLYRSADPKEECMFPIDKRPKKPESRGHSPVNYHLWFEHIDAVIRALREKNLRPLVMLHARHVKEHRLWSKYDAMVEGWRSDGLLFCTPNGVEDDLCW
eukprot:CAMPEP_0201512064 /NCGR_PEP_ID=MMETSP0161_2-20130828/4408_1 /ASSEMBLY_ACC=CAM_ASM_000251 /TAXON_ID=180227 /ORGANISM="Neoparamoeba aestuarina, Strain SoJaBio B1-5/56/2" /LENGTH=141 /DNA_ID=CAMNT_0047907787 /DNA_START=212 /DNA_END=634 /DNA_ORIENTATION=-